MKIKIGKVFFSDSTRKYDLNHSHGVGLLELGGEPDGWLPKDCVAVAGGESVERSISEMLGTGIWQVVQGDKQNLEKQVSVASVVIEKPDSLFESPAEKILKSGKGEFHKKRWLFRSSNEKGSVLESIDEYLKGIKGANALREAVRQVADEFYTNALFNGPFGGAEVTLDRSTVVVLNADSMAELIIAHNDDQMFVGCIDMFGTLDCESLLKTLNLAYKRGVGKSINWGEGGAGIGFLRVLSLSNDLYVISEEGSKTLVGCTFFIGKSPKTSRTSPKNIHFQRYKKIDLNSSSLKIQKRGHRAFIKLNGNLKEVGQILDGDLEGITEIFFDIRKLEESDAQHLKYLFDWIRSFSLTKKVSFNYVPLGLFSAIEKFVESCSTECEIRSLLLPFVCKPCHNLIAVLFVRRGSELKAAVEKDSKGQAPLLNCKKCGLSMVPAGELGNLVIE